MEGKSQVSALCLLVERSSLVLGGNCEGKQTAAQARSSWDWSTALKKLFYPHKPQPFCFFDYRHVVLARVFLVPVVIDAVSLSGICSR